MTNAIRPLFMLLAIAAVCGCAQEKERAAGPQLVAAIDRENGVAFVDPAYADRLAKNWRVENASADQWTITRGRDKPYTVKIVRKKPGLAGALGETTWYGCKCTGNNPPGADNTVCMRSPNTGGSQKVLQTVGYSFCADSGNPNDQCDAARVQVGDWIYYSDPGCQTETRRVPFTRSVCLP